MSYPPYGSPDPYGYGSPDPYQQAGYQQAGYQQPAPVAYPVGPPVVARTNGMATAAMVVGIISAVLTLISCGFFGVTGPLAVIFGHLAQGQIKRTGEAGSGQAVAGLVLGYLTSAIVLIAWIFVFGIYGWAFWSLDHSTSDY
ncbi:DUF4190 domain-containing protein [Actinomadura parmotrematis]|uniref:DUF4190 domain-containing protein n=1 Tax=Actinomadura parmotrematis TaxID=2864039 RepID=A0ABS7G2T9_9ACTN|nr:DUF4190 domain-containing protein [Actinomadura parmotrematis]MBW8487040.1 DUF4190 domain-containing protein [Actinomadura parmotrematis]